MGDTGTVNIGTTRRVLVLGQGERAFLSVIRSLGRAGLGVDVGMCPPDALALKSRYVRHYHDIPQYAPGESSWLESVLDVVQAAKYDLVIPCTDPALIPLQIHREVIEPHCRVYTLDKRAFEVAFDKIESCKLAAECGLHLPKQKEFNVDEPIDDILADMELPVVLKPPSSFSADKLSDKRKVVCARTREQFAELLDLAKGWDRALVQEYFVGVGCGVEVLASDGEILVAFQHVRVHEPLGGGGSSYRRSSALHPDLISATKRLIAAMEYTGVAMVEFKMNMQTGAWIFVEINGRFWGSLPLAIAAGVDFPRYLYEMLVLGRKRFPQEYRVGMYCRNLTPDLRWLEGNLMADRSDPLLATRPLGKVLLEALNFLTFRESWDTLAVDDVRPGFEEIRRIGRDVTSKIFAVVRRCVSRGVTGGQFRGARGPTTNSNRNIKKG